MIKFTRYGKPVRTRHCSIYIHPPSRTPYTRRYGSDTELRVTHGRGYDSRLPYRRQLSSVISQVGTIYDAKLCCFNLQLSATFSSWSCTSYRPIYRVRSPTTKTCCTTERRSVEGSSWSPVPRCSSPLEQSRCALTT